MDSRRKFLGTVASGLAGTIASVPVLGAPDRIRIGVIGAGDRGLELCHQIKACPGTEIAAFADIYSKRLEKAASYQPSAKLFADHRQLLDDANIDAVVIATPPHLHAQHFCDALSAGKHIYLEKTLALTHPQAQQMRGAYENDGGRHAVQIGHQSCSTGHASDVARFLAEPNAIGPVSTLAMRHYRNSPINRQHWSRPTMLTPDLNLRNIAWARFAGEGTQFDPQRFIQWRHYWEYSSGPISEYMSQQLAFWYRALDLQIPWSATATGGVFLPDGAGRDTPDTVQVSLTQPENMLVTWSSGFGNNQLGVGEDLLGRAGTISRNNQLRYVPQKVTRPQGAEMLGRASQNPEAHLQNFLDAIRFGSDVNCPFEVGYRVAMACIMATESYRLGRTVYWNAETQEIV